jgi:peptidoglycan hydrolase CwlO-like protein
MEQVMERMLAKMDSFQEKTCANQAEMKTMQQKMDTNQAEMKATQQRWTPIKRK